MRTRLQVLSEDERAQVHERSLRVLARTGLFVHTAQGRRILREAGAKVDEMTHQVRFPRPLVEESLRLAPREFSLGARRPGWDLAMNGGDCTMLIDGEAMFVMDRHTGERRPGTCQDVLEATRLIDALDPVGVYWEMLEASDRGDEVGDWVASWHSTLANFSKHLQRGIADPDTAPWLREILQVVFGDRETIRERHPISFLLCPQSPLMITESYTDAYLALLGLEIPAVVMPMPLMGATAPASLISTVVCGNCEVLGMLCLLQAAAPGTPVIYAPALVVMDPRSGSYSAGAIENGLLGAAATEMARFYGLPAESSGLGTDHYVPGIQAGYERALNGLLPVLSWPDILVGPGLLGGSMVLSLEQLIIDVEIFEMCRRASRGIAAGEDRWLEDVLEAVGPGQGFLAETSTARAVRGGEWYVSRLGLHGTYESWEQAGRPTLLEEARDKVETILAQHEPLPLDELVRRELERIEQRARSLD